MKRMMTLGATLALSAAFCHLPAAASSLPSAVTYRVDRASVVERNDVRFTIITPRLIRMEWSPDRIFVDAPSQVFVNRHQPLTAFAVAERRGQIRIETDALSLTYRLGSGRFTATNLAIRSTNRQMAFTWRPGDPEPTNLLGTARTLDNFDGDLNQKSGERLTLEPGLLSRAGWHVVDDSKSFLFDDRPWRWAARRPCARCQDLYFFGYGHRYEKALADYAQVAGREPMPPRFALGYWWSRYWNYSDSETRDLIADFKRYDIPLDVLVLDMDWHRTDGLDWDPRYVQHDAFGQLVGWTGYSWNKSLYPDPPRLLSWLHGERIKTTLNLHPASGVTPGETAYPAFARAMGIADGRTVPFEAADARMMKGLFDTVLDPLQAEGVDFWWLDWQQWPESKAMPGLSNTWWLNHLFYTHMQQADRSRALIFHRWGGLGNHRYQIGFSGDSIISWRSLAYQPFFTSTASNVLYGYWSHDLGGHKFADATPDVGRRIDPELYVRWMQFGAFSPIMRTHSAKEPGLRKEPWRFSPEVFGALRGTIDLRYRLAPYIYAAAREAYDTGVSLIRPLYYGWPEEAHAYDVGGEYMFGNDLLVAPVTRPMTDAAAIVSIWLPPGRWYDVARGEPVDGGRTVRRDYALDEVPVFARAGAIVPMNPPSTHRLQGSDDGRRVLRVYPGGDASIRLYDDAGDSEGYRRGEFAFTPVTSRSDAGTLHLRIGPPEGAYPGMPDTREYVVELPGIALPGAVTIDGRPLDRSSDGRVGTWSYDGKELTARIHMPRGRSDRMLAVDVRLGDRPPGLDGLRYRMKRASAAVAWLKEHWNSPSPLPDDVSLAAQLGRLIDYRPEHLPALIGSFDERLGTITRQVNESHADPAVKARFAHMIAIARGS